MHQRETVGQILQNEGDPSAIFVRLRSNKMLDYVIRVRYYICKLSLIVISSFIHQLFEIYFTSDYNIVFKNYFFTPSL